MIVNFSRLLKEQEKIIHIDKKISNFIPEINIQDDLIVKGTIRKANHELYIDLRIILQLNLVCSRCLSTYSYPMNLKIHERYDLAEHEQDIHDDRIDLAELLRENILINIPIKPICDEKCKGLCQNCGKNKNVEDCNCDNNQVDPRLSVLSNIFNGDE
ncbi:MAG: YceD family protein [Eubacteriales bacterium]